MRNWINLIENALSNFDCTKPISGCIDEEYVHPVSKPPTDYISIGHGNGNQELWFISKDGRFNFHNDDGIVTHSNFGDDVVVGGRIDHDKWQISVVRGISCHGHFGKALSKSLANKVLRKFTSLYPKYTVWNCDCTVPKRLDMMVFESMEGPDYYTEIGHFPEDNDEDEGDSISYVGNYWFEYGFDHGPQDFILGFTQNGETACQQESRMWAKRLRREGFDAKVMEGFYHDNGGSRAEGHVWLIVNGSIFDPTASQFDDFPAMNVDQFDGRVSD